MNRKSNFFAVAFGIFFLVSGLFANEWFLKYFFSPDGRLILATRILIWLFDLVMIGSGVFLLVTKSFPKLILVCLSIIITLLLIETGLSGYFDLSKDLFIPNPRNTGSYRLKPGLHIQRKIGAASFLFQTNSLGMPWREVEIENPKNRTRIAFVGDSFVFGCCASRIENNFVGRIDRKLNSKYEVLNFGVVGYGLADEELMIREEVLRFHPSYVVLMFYNGNDFSDTFLSLDSKGKLLGIHGRSPDDRPETATKFTATQKRLRVITNSALFRVLNQLFETREDPRKIFADPNRFDSWVYWSKRTYTPVAEKAKQISLQVLGRILEFCGKNHIQAFVITIPYVNQVYSDEITTADYDFNLPQKYVSDSLKGSSAYYYDLLPPLRNYARNNRNEIYLPGDGHFNDEGHKLVAEILFNYFQNELHQ